MRIGGSAHVTNAAYESTGKIHVSRERHPFLDAGRSNGGRVPNHCRGAVPTGRTISLTEPTEIFETGRDAIERAASNKYDRTSRRPYEVLTITADDLELDSA